MADLIDNFIIKFVHVLYASIKDFNKNRCLYSASSLSFFSLSTFVPFLAILVGVATYFKSFNLLKNFLLVNFSIHHDLILLVISKLNKFVKNTNMGLITLIGVFFIVMMLFNIFLSLEDTFNTIWKAEQGRSWINKLIFYPLLTLIGPIIFIMVLSIGITFLGAAKSFLYSHEILSTVLPIIQGSIFVSNLATKIIPHFVFWIILFNLYIYLPNAKVKFLPALIGSLVATALFIGIQTLYIYLQINLTRHNALYGSFAIIPFLLLSIHYSWGIILYGSQLSYSIQNPEQ
ncbi:MAG: YihY/virulence factor BrkB family protein [Candidatus Margulisbacteria bacterium]|nr:YihY/virulence factor BrkB family protein [Candidatus Margulisiibacteriota bacterium]